MESLLTRGALALLLMNLVVLAVLWALPMPDPGDLPGRSAQQIVGAP